MPEFSAVPSGIAKFSAATEGAGVATASACSVDSAAMMASVGGALGACGANYIAAYAPAQANNLAAGMQVASVYAAISGTTDASKSAIIRAEYS